MKRHCRAGPMVPFSEADAADSPTEATEDGALFAAGADLSAPENDESGWDVPAHRDDDSVYADDPDADAGGAFDRELERARARDDDSDDDYDDLDDDYGFADDDGEGDYDDDLDDEEADARGKRHAGAGAGIAEKGKALVARLRSGRKPRLRPGAKKVRGAGRTRTKAEPSAKTPRKTRTRVVGAREARIKQAKMAAAVVLTLGTGYLVHQPILGALNSAQASLGKTFVSARDGLRETVKPDAVPDLSVAMTGLKEEEAPAPAASGGWGARVVKADATDTGAASKTGDQIAGIANSAARGALNIAERALGAVQGEGNERLEAVLAAATGQVVGMRHKLATEGVSPDEAADRAAELVAQGQEHFAAGRLVAPPGRNAYDSYREALDFDPEFEDAKAGIRELRDHYAAKADGAREARQWENANSFYETAISISNLRKLK